MTGFGIKDWKLAGIFVSIALLLLAFWNVDFNQLWVVVKSAKPLPILAVLLLNFGIIALKAWRWQLVINATKVVKFSSVIMTTLVGFMANNLLPARAGELVRIFALGKREGISKTTVLGTLALDRVFDGVGMMAVLVALPFMMETSERMRTITLWFVVIIAALFALVIMLARQEQAGWVKHLPISDKWMALAEEMFLKLRDGFKTVNSFKLTTAVLVVSIGTWFVQALMVMLCLQSIGIDQFGIPQALFILMAINLAIIIPAAPGNFGTFEISAVVALGMLDKGIGDTQRLSFA
ncbi:MAG: lysylphosphatidylglycerol synthase transmembrane domain-containing protein, partial [Myxococcota bacterium]